MIIIFYGSIFHQNERMSKLNLLFVIFESLPSSVGTDGGHIVAATKVNNEFFVNDDAKDIQAVSLDYINKNVILIAYKE